jgi:hypothetical protein
VGAMDISQPLSSVGCLWAAIRCGREMEVHSYVDLHCDGFAVFGCRGKFPVLHGVHGCLIKLGAKQTSNSDLARHTFRADDKPQYNCPCATATITLPSFTGCTSNAWARAIWDDANQVGIGFRFPQAGVSEIGSATDAIPRPQPEPRTIREHFSAPSIRSPEVACAERPDIRRFEGSLRLAIARESLGIAARGGTAAPKSCPAKLI